VAHVDGLRVDEGVASTDHSTATSHSGEFARGDVVPGERSVTVAIGRGRRAAASVDAFLAGVTPEPEPERELAEFAFLNPWYYEDAPRSHRLRP
jgi:hypothetical protein